MNKQSTLALVAILTIALASCEVPQDTGNGASALDNQMPRAARTAEATSQNGAQPNGFAPTSASNAGYAQGFAVAHLGDVLTTSQGQTLYVHQLDGLNRSTCRQDCAQSFFPYIPTIDSQPGRQYGFFMRDDGVTQWAIEGKPLYVFRGDTAPKQRNGAGIYNMSTIQYPTLGAAWTPEYAPMFPNGTENLPMYGSSTK